MFNILKDSGVDAVRTYAETLTEDERKQVFMMFDTIQREGYNKTKDLVLEQA